MKLYLIKKDGVISLKFFKEKPILPIKYKFSCICGNNTREYKFEPNYESKESFDKQTLDFIAACKDAGAEIADNVIAYAEFLAEREKKRVEELERRYAEEQKAREEKNRLEQDFDDYVSKTHCTTCKECKFNCSYGAPWARFCRYINEKAKQADEFNGEYLTAGGKSYLFGENRNPLLPLSR